MIKLWLRHFLKTLVLFLILSAIMFYTQTKDYLIARFGEPTPEQLYFVNELNNTNEIYYAMCTPLETTLMWGMGLWQILIPLISTYSVFSFLVYKDKVMHFTAIRKNKYSRELIKNIILTALIGALAVYIGYVIVFEWAAAYFPSRSLLGEEIIGGYTMFADIFDRETLIEHYRLYYLIEGLVSYFLISLEFGLLTIYVSLRTDKKYLIVLIPFLFYVISALMGSGELDYYSVLAYTAPSTYQYIMTTYMVCYHVIVLVIIGGIIYYYIKKNKERIM